MFPHIPQIPICPITSPYPIFLQNIPNIFQNSTRVGLLELSTLFQVQFVFLFSLNISSYYTLKVSILRYLPHFCGVVKGYWWGSAYWKYPYNGFNSSSYKNFYSDKHFSINLKLFGVQWKLFSPSMYFYPIIDSFYPLWGINIDFINKCYQWKLFGFVWRSF